MEPEDDKLIGTRISLQGEDGKRSFTYVVDAKLDTMEKIEAFREQLSAIVDLGLICNTFTTRLMLARPDRPLYYCRPEPGQIGPMGSLLYEEEVLEAAVEIKASEAA